MSDSVISLQDVSKYYKLYHTPKDRLKEALHPKGKSYHKKFYATRHLTLDVKKGEILGIVGKNGSGKSTLLKLITGVLKPDEGKISVKGKISALLELGSGFNPEFTGMQNIFFYGTILGFTKQQMTDKLDDIIAFADIGEFIDQPIKTYSSGMKSRLGFAVAVHIEPEILILDEVLSVGDELFKRKSYAKMEEFFKEGKTILYVSHSANSINQLCTRAILLDQGNIVLDGEPKVVTASYQKLLFSKGANRKQLLEEMSQKSTIPTVSKKIEKFVDKKKETAYFIPEMQSETVVEQKREGAEISNARFETLDGEPVNVLQINERYRYIYDVTFSEALTNVLFGMQIKTIKGQLITGSNNEMLGDEMAEVSTEKTYTIIWEFTTSLIPGNYYTDMSVFTKNRGELTPYHKITDAMVFKVVSTSKPFFGGLTHLNQSLSIVSAKRESNV